MWQYDIVPVGTKLTPEQQDDPDTTLLEGCECDNTHNQIVCRWCWAFGRRDGNDPAVTDPRPVVVRLV